MGRKKKEGLEEEVKRIVQKEIDNSLSDNLFDDENDNHELPETFTPPEDPHMEKILTSFPSSQGYYGKLYRKNPSGKMEFKYFIDHLEDIDDPELEIANMIKENHWRGGEYVLRIQKRNDPSVTKLISWTIAQDENPMGVTERADSLGSIKDTLSIVKDLTGSSISDTYKSAFDVAKNLFGNASDKSDKLGILEMLTILEKIRPREKTTIEMLTEFKAMKDVLSPTEEPEEKKSLLEQFTEMKALMDLLGGEAVSGPVKPLTLLIQTLAPRIPDLVHSITEPIKSLIELQKLKLTGVFAPPRIDMGIAGESIIPPPGSLPSVSSSPPLEINTIQKEQDNFEKMKLKVFTQDLHQAIENNNLDFDYIISGIRFTFGSGFMQQYFSKILTKDLIISSLSSLDPYFKEIKAAAYFNAFFTYVDSLQPEKYKCNKCPNIEELTSAEYLENSSCSVCEDGLLIKISSNNDHSTNIDTINAS